jgi:hypothetical protein
MIKSKKGNVRIEGPASIVAADFACVVAGFMEMLIKENGSVSDAFDKVCVLSTLGLQQVVPNLKIEIKSEAIRRKAGSEETND